MEKQGLSKIESSSQYSWIFMKLRRPVCSSYLWNVASNITITSVGVFSKFLINCLNRTVCHNQENFLSIVERRGKGVPLITVSNHLSCFDDPGIWGCLNIAHLNYKKMRWSLAAHNICFTNRFYAYFFMLGKCIPVVRGEGVYQEAVNFCIERLKEGEWVHIFPEGKVNMNREFIRFKWGIGRIIYELPVTPIIIPIWHIGMEDILPNQPPYIFRIGKQMTINFGKPIDLSKLVRQLKYDKVDPKTARCIITKHIQDELMSLKAQTEPLHSKMKYFLNF